MKLLRFLNFILESRSKKLLPVVFSEEFRDKIDNIGNSFISSAFKEIYHNDSETYKEFTLISVGNSEDTISYVDSYKIIDLIGDTDITKIKQTDPICQKNRTDIKVGRFINRFFPNTFTDKAIEDFVNKWKSTTPSSTKFEIWSGTDIKNAYKSNNYHFTEGGSNPLMNSCMNDKINLVDFYAYCPGLSVVVLLDEKDHILGRALLWKDTEGRYIMDRIYYIYDKDYFKFIRLADDHDWFYKKKIKNYSRDFIKNGKEYGIKSQVRIPDSFKFKDDGFPFMDTFCFAQGELAMNYEPFGYYLFLQDTEGGWSEIDNPINENDI